MLLILDIDGVMTDGTKMYDKHGDVSHKKYCDSDFTAIKRFKESGWDVCFVSEDTVVNHGMARKRKIDFYHCGRGEGSTDKSIVLPEIMKKYNAKKKDIVYVGDDVNDLSVMRKVGKAFCVQNSPQIVKKEIQSLPAKSGEGVVKILFDIIVEKVKNE